MRIERILEQELMDNRKQAIAYAKADFSDSNRLYVDNLIADYPEYLNNVIDLGCGPADIPIRLAKANPDIRIIAVDGSAEMIKLARKAVQNAGLEKQVISIQGYLPGFDIGGNRYDAVLSKDMLHHLPNPMVLWNETRCLGREGAAIYVMDLFRPETLEDVKKIVENISANESPSLKEDFFNSLCASFTMEEVKEQLKKAHLNLDVSQISERHMLIKGILD